MEVNPKCIPKNNVKIDFPLKLGFQNPKNGPITNDFLRAEPKMIDCAYIFIHFGSLPTKGGGGGASTEVNAKSTPTNSENCLFSTKIGA